MDLFTIVVVGFGATGVMVVGAKVVGTTGSGLGKMLATNPSGGTITMGGGIVAIAGRTRPSGGTMTRGGPAASSGRTRSGPAGAVGRNDGRRVVGARVVNATSRTDGPAAGAVGRAGAVTTAQSSTRTLTSAEVPQRDVSLIPTAMSATLIPTAMPETATRRSVRRRLSP